jgi:SAM-dependent methyltransferase
VKPDKKPLRVPSLERFYPEIDEELGVAASDISIEAKQRHFARYARIIQLIKRSVSRSDLVVDIGCGTGYGTHMLGQHFKRVLGVEPDDEARRYAAKHYPSSLFANDLGDLKADVAVMVESIEHMTRGEARLYLKDTRVLALTTPLIEHPNNEYHEQSFKKPEDVHAYVGKLGFVVTAVNLLQGITFTTLETGSNLHAVYTRSLRD